MATKVIAAENGESRNANNNGTNGRLILNC
jgi:hypothetical protein